MGKIVGKIVLTGGPCAGKTTALSKIEIDLIEKGYRVMVVGESATELIKGGIRPFGNSPLDLITFQKLILEYQMNKERIYEQAVKSLPKEEKCVMIYDRGLLDNKAYISQKQFSNILNNMNLSELNLMDNYDMVIHLVTAADGKEEYYTLGNNSARTETVEEAIALDKKTVNAWVGHNNLKIIDNSTDFEEKLDRTINTIHNLLGDPIPLKQQRKFTIDLEESNLMFLNNEECTKIEIKQTYLVDPCEIKYEKRLRKRTYEGENTYYFTVQKKETQGLSKIVTDKKISEKEYLKLLSMYEKKYTISKTRYAFVKNKQYLRLDVFDDYKDLAILEVEPTNENQIINIPDNLCVIKEVTDDIEFHNYSIANKKNKEKHSVKKVGTHV